MIKNAWQIALSDLVCDPKELLTLLELDNTLLDAAISASKHFPLKVPRRFLARIEKGNLNDPLLRQILPLGVELKKVKGYVKDPLHEINSNKIPGLLHKYKGRVLITLTSACAIHCRYCFRRHFPYHDNNPGKAGLEKIMDYIRQENEIEEVILSGGDPLAVSDKLLAIVSEQLHAIPHIKRLRLHTRIPVVLPERITSDFIAWINSLSLEAVMVIHANHPNEINDEVKDAMFTLRSRTNITLFNQSVLLKSINDDANTLIQLSKSLFSAGVIPYYLHVLDKVAGSHHFDVDRKTACQLHEEMTKQLPGYLVPKLACEEPQEYAKTILSSMVC